MLKKIRMTLIGFCLLPCVGCTVHGKWSVASIDPTAARRDFDFQSLTLQEDGTFYIEANEAYGIEASSGVYSFEDGVLHLKEHDGESHTYNAELTHGGKKLRLQEFWEGQKLIAVLERRA